MQVSAPIMLGMNRSEELFGPSTGIGMGTSNGMGLEDEVEWERVRTLPRVRLVPPEGELSFTFTIVLVYVIGVRLTIAGDRRGRTDHTLSTTTLSPTRNTATSTPTPIPLSAFISTYVPAAALFDDFTAKFSSTSTRECILLEPYLGRDGRRFYPASAQIC